MRIRGPHLALVAALAACQSPPRVPAPPPAPAPRLADEPLPGQRWITKPQPWRLAHSSIALAVAAGGKVALVGGDRGRIARYDLLHGGRATATVKLPTHLAVAAITELAPKRWLAIVQSADYAVKASGAVFVVRETGDGLVAEPAPMHWRGLASPNDRNAAASAAMLPDGSVAIGGTGLPLASYDPLTFGRRTLFDDAHSWSSLRVAGHYLYAASSRGNVRIDLATHAQLALDYQTAMLAADGRIVSLQFAGPHLRSVSTRDPENSRDAAVHFKALYAEVGVDPVAPRLVGLEDGALVVRTLDDQPVRSIPLGFAEIAPDLANAAWAGDRLVFQQGQTLRVADLAAGTITPYGDGPWAGAPMAVTGTGTVIVHKYDTAWELAGGVPIHTLALPHDATSELQVGSPRNLLVRRDHTITLWDPANPTPRATWTVEQDPREAHCTRDGSALDYAFADHDGQITMLRMRAGDIADERPVVFRSAWNALLQDYAADAQTALVEWNGNVGVVRAGKIEPYKLYYPGCADEGVARLEDATSARAATWASQSVALWDVGSGALVGAAKFASEIGFVVFAPGTRAAWVGGADRLSLWTPGGETRAVVTNDVDYLAVSADGKLLAVSYRDGRVALVDARALAAAMPVVARPAPLTMPETCGTQEPLGVDQARDSVFGDGGECEDCEE